ncbi:MAG: hypothetical protein F6K58_17710 [Symploca sp. SIO2E9]|nr:hypothetical protein [Symploca sp. SIO2E9]
MSEQDKIKQMVEEAEYAATSATGSATINVYNYHYSEDIRVKPIESNEAAALEKLPCPYRGLFHFGPNDAEVFFGREVFVEKLFKATQTRNFIPLLGASGSGKSSVVLAGLVPKLKQEGHWKFTHFRPGSDPFHTLALALVPLYAPNLDDTDKIAQARKLASYLNDNTVPLSDVFAKIQQNHFNHRILLIADQFEEIYTQCSDHIVRRRFLDCLLASFQVSNSGSPFSTVLATTMRADFLANALSYRPLADMLQNQDIKLSAMSRLELIEVIEKPAQKLGVKFEAGLVERILNDVENEPGNLPLLEFALTELWQKRTSRKLTHKAYEAIGQVKGALAKYAEEKYCNFTPCEQKQAKRIFVQLVYPGKGIKDSRRLATRTEIGDNCWSLISRKDGLADARLAVTGINEATGEETVEVVHEALIQEWQRLQDWIINDRKFRTWQEELRSVIDQWQQTGKDKGALLRGKRLLEAQDWLQKREADLESEKEYIEASFKEEKEKTEGELALVIQSLRQKRKTRKARQTTAFITIVLVIALAIIGGFWWQQSVKLKYTEVLALAADGIAKPELLPAANNLLEQANRLSKSEKKADVEVALINYRAAINLTKLMTEQLESKPEGLNETFNLAKKTFDSAEKGLIQLIYNKRIPKLEEELKAPKPKIGEKVSNTRTDFENQFTKGALRTTYAILRREFGVKADIYNSGRLSTEKEADRMPCDTLKRIQDLWREHTDCGWYSQSDNNLYIDLSCQALGGETLTAKIFNFPFDAAIARLKFCKCVPQ